MRGLRNVVIRGRLSGGGRLTLSRVIGVTVIAAGALGVGSAAVVPGVAAAGSFVVTDCSGSPSDSGSLPYAIANATSGETVDFSVSCPAVSPIVVTSAMTMSQSLELTGPGAGDLVISGNNASRVFVVDPGVTADISGITVEDASYSPQPGGAGIRNSGDLTVSDCVFSGDHVPTWPEGGGAIANDGTLSVVDSTFSGNGAGDGGAIDNGDGFAGGNGTLEVTDSTFTDNSAVSGGAIDNGDYGGTGTVTVTGSTFSGNSASDPGGAIANEDGQLTVTDSTFAGNSAGQGERSETRRVKTAPKTERRRWSRPPSGRTGRPAAVPVVVRR